MGEAAPVGSLVVTRPVPLGKSLHVGEVVVFRVPESTTVFVHRVVQVMANGHYRTKGDLEQVPDPWVITASNVIGKPVAIIPAIGWVYKLTVWFFLGATILVVADIFADKRKRRWLRIVGPILLLVIPLWRYHPLVGGYVLGSSNRKTESVARIVDTGILPVDFSMSGGSLVYAAPGQAVYIFSTRHINLAQNRSGSMILPIRVVVALTWWGWVLLVLVCMLPLLFLEIDIRYARYRARLLGQDTSLVLTSRSKRVKRSLIRRTRRAYEESYRAYQKAYEAAGWWS
jgi:hypothetical protein